jgi:hypothetical protein
MGRKCSLHGEITNARRVLIGKRPGKWPLRKLRIRLQDLGEAGCEDGK